MARRKTKKSKIKLPEYERERRKRIKAMHKLSGYYKKPPRRTVSGGSMSKK